MPKGKDWLWIIVGALLAVFVVPFVTSKVANRKSNG